MKKMVLIALMLLPIALLPTMMKGQEGVMLGALQDWSLIGRFDKPYSSDFGSTSWNSRITAYFYDYKRTALKMKIGDSDDTATYVSSVHSFGITSHLATNSGSFNDHRYGEFFESYSLGLCWRMTLPNYHKFMVSGSIGRMKGEYTLRSGYKTNSRNTFISGSVGYSTNMRRMNKNLLFTTVSGWLTGNLPWPGDNRDVPGFGYPEFQHRQGLESQNLNSLHFLAELGLIDFGLSLPINLKIGSSDNDEYFGNTDTGESQKLTPFLVGIKSRALAGKYDLDSRDIKYFGFGSGLELIVNRNLVLASLDLDYIWVQRGSKADGFYLGVSFDLASAVSLISSK